MEYLGLGIRNDQETACSELFQGRNGLPPRKLNVNAKLAVAETLFLERGLKLVKPCVKYRSFRVQVAEMLFLVRGLQPNLLSELK